LISVLHGFEPSIDCADTRKPIPIMAADSQEGRSSLEIDSPLTSVAAHFRDDALEFATSTILRSSGAF
jgi:hypothetical protein